MVWIVDRASQVPPSRDFTAPRSITEKRNENKISSLHFSRVISDTTTRNSDTWNLKCVFSEFIIRMLRGYDELYNFNPFVFDRFWVEEEAGLRVQFRMQSWMNHIAGDLAGTETALQSVL